ncbi:hypothetical protein H072_10728 [Dactylellina haptotyla CBS 200.50]|uniref:G domain-containing protein n=1 Tax=Dactylellina haptotyla (strain CBS 200.50) TaxID=1284197 RepID=S8B9W6_DACHA|nr:hypothetical protein H072_10728 [Dactylellina haptotyla CBS 200.50]
MDGSGDTVNILVIGPSQNGKSTFINKIREMSRPTEQKQAEEGDGNSSCTTKCAEYVFDFPRTRYRLFDHKNDQYVHVAEEDEQTYFSELWRKKTSDFCEIRRIEENPRYFNLRVIDTPGLDDSNRAIAGQDDRNIAEVMGHLHRMATTPGLPKYITALVLILNVETPFSNHLQKIFKYYQLCMPNLFGGLAIINTSFTAEVWKTKFNDSRRMKSRMEKVTKAFSADTSKVDMMRERRADFAAIFERDARHFFIDSVPDKMRIVEQLTSHNQMYDIITYLACQSQMPVNNIKLYKSPRMVQIDELLIIWLNDARRNLMEKEMELTTHLGEAQAVRAQNAKKLESLRAEIEQLEKELNIYNNDDDYPLKTYSTGGQDRASTPALMGRYIIRTKIKNTYVIKEPDYPGFKVTTYNDEPYARWGMQTFTDSGRSQWAGQYEGSPGHLPILTAKTLVSNKQFYRSQITKLKTDITARSADLNSEKELHKYFLSQDSIDSETLDPTLKLISLRLPEIDKLVNSLASEWLPLDEGLDDAARKRYNKDIKDKLNLYDLVEMAESKGYKALGEKLREMIGASPSPFTVI